MPAKFKYLVFFTIVLTACSPAQRLERIVKRNPQLLEKQTITVTVRDTVIRPGLNIFTPVVIQSGEIIQKTVNGVDLKLERENDTIRIYVNIPGDTVYIEKEANVDVDTMRVYQTKKELPLLDKLLVLAIVVSVLYCFLKWFGRKMDDHKQNGKE